MADYYVALGGNDSHGNGTISNPWKSISKGVDALNAGDTLYLRAGTYNDHNAVDLNKNGTTIAGYRNERVIWDVRREYPPDTNGSAPYTPLIKLSADRVVVDDLELKNSRGRAISASGDNCIIRNCQVDWTGSNGIHVEGDNCVVENCVVKDSVQISSMGGQLQFVDVDGGIARNNTVTGGLGEGLLCLRSRNCQTYNNTLYDIEGGHLVFDNVDTGLIDSNAVFRTEQNRFAPWPHIKLAQEYYEGRTVKTENITVTNNISVGGNFCFTFGIGADRLGPGGPLVPVPNAGFKNCKIANNTFVNGSKGTVKIADSEVTDTSEHTRCWFVNNIVVQDDDEARIFVYRAPSTVAKWVFGSNLYTELPGSDVRGSGDIIGSPQLVNHNKRLRTPADFDPANYSLTETSPAINTAATNFPITVAKDYFDNTRDNEPDIGMHEFAREDVISANFSASPTTGTAPLTVQFRDRSESSSPITSRFWDFGDGVVSTEQNPVHEYRQGRYTVSLRVAGEAGTDIRTKDNLINIEAHPPSNNNRVTEGLNVLYRFDEGSGNTVYDVSGNGSPLDLTITNMSAVTWLRQGLRIGGRTAIVSNGPASKINDACRESNAFTVEAWLKPRNLTQDGPARIVSISLNTHSRNITLGQGLWGTQPSNLYDVRLRTTERSANGMPSFSSPPGTATTNKTHVVFTRRRDGQFRLYINKIIVAETMIPGDFSTWNPRFPLLVGNETTGEHPWLGDMFLLAVYERALMIREVEQNFNAGTDLSPRSTVQSNILTTSFRRFVLVNNGNGFGQSNGNDAAVAYGVQYPDMRCVLCADGKLSSMAIYPDVNAIVRAYGKQGLQIKWID